ncbi:MAG: esterase-like activity of phytase family protein [Actinomycetota bacterium]
MPNHRPSWVRRIGGLLTLSLLASLVAFASPAGATDYQPEGDDFFERTGTFVVADNLDAGEDPGTETSAEIVAASPDGKTLIYSDSPAGRIGFVDISDPSDPKPDGFVPLPADHEPTAVAVWGAYVLVGVNTSADFVNPSGYLLVLSLADRSQLATIDLGGQPDSIGVNDDSVYGAVVVENERDEDLADGDIPQLPAGYLVAVTMEGDPADWTTEIADLTGLADVAPTDPEPEYVDVNSRGVAVVTLQENNHLAVVNLRTANVLRHFSAGTTDLTGIDTVEEEPAVIDPTGSLDAVPREPDAVAWISNSRFATANEGDYLGGSRGFSIYGSFRGELYDSGNDFEHLGLSIGHYPDSRSENKGTEPEGIEYGVYDGDRFLFVGAERGNYVGVYTLRGATPRFQQVLPTGVGPEGLLAIPERNLFIVASEVDVAEAGIRSLITIYERGAARAPYPGVQSKDGASGAPIGWGALSGLAADPQRVSILYGVHDGAYGETRVYTIRTRYNGTGRIIDETPILLPDGADLDPEGITVDDARNWWIATEGDDDGRKNQLIRVRRTTGEIMDTVDLPDEVVANQVRFGLEGISHVDKKLYVVFQREWADDPAGQVKIGRYDLVTEEWDFTRYSLDAVESPAGGWVGLSEIVHVEGDVFAVVERDNQAGPDKRVARLYTVALDDEAFGPAANPGSVAKSEPWDVLPILDEASQSGWWGDKLEGLAIDRWGRLWYATDNDGLDGSTGETLFGQLFTRDYLPRPPMPAYSVTVFHHNDAESGILPDDGIGGAAEFKTALDSMLPAAEEGSDRSAILVSAGDNFLPGPALQAGIDDGISYDALAQDTFGYDALALGNHDFDLGPDFLAEYIRQFDSEVFISANLDVTGELELLDLKRKGRIAASVVVHEDGRRIGIVGATTNDLPFVSSPRNVVVNSDVAAAIQAEVDALRAGGVEVVIVSSHLQGLDQDREIIPLLRGVDAYVAGGGDELLANPGDPLAPGDEPQGAYPQVVADADGIERPLVATPGDYSYLGRLELQFDQYDNLIGFGGGSTVISGFEPDPEVKAAAQDPVEQAVAELATTVLADSEVGLDATRPNIRIGETNEGSLIADALLWQGQQLAASFGVDAPQVALQNGGGIRNADVRGPGDITALDTFAMVPFPNFVSVFEDMTSAELELVLENAYSRIEFVDGRFAHIAGMTVEIDAAATPLVIDEETGEVTQDGARVLTVTLDDGTDVVVDGEPVDGVTVDVATIDFLARGGDQYPFPESFTVLGASYQQALANFLVAPVADGGLGGAITAADYPEGGSGRIVIDNPPTIE